MSQRTAELLRDVLGLSDEERASFTDELLASFDPGPGEADPLSDEELLAELDRRSAELHANPQSGIPWDAVLKLL